MHARQKEHSNTMLQVINSPPLKKFRQGDHQAGHCSIARIV